MWCHKATALGGNGKKLPWPASLQAGRNTAWYFHITPTKHNYGRNKSASVTKQPELHNWVGGGGGSHQHNTHALFPRYKLHCHTL